MTELVQVNGHQIDIFYSIWTGKETIKYDGNSSLQSQKFDNFFIC